MAVSRVKDDLLTPHARKKVRNTGEKSEEVMQRFDLAANFTKCQNIISNPTYTANRSIIKSNNNNRLFFSLHRMILILPE